MDGGEERADWIGAWKLSGKILNTHAIRKNTIGYTQTSDYTHHSHTQKHMHVHPLKIEACMHPVPNTFTYLCQALHES